MASFYRSFVRFTNILAIVVLVFSPLPQNAHANSKAGKIAALVQKYHDARLFNGAILVAEKGKVIFKKGYGYANIEWQIPNAPDAKYRIGSVTKQFTASIILQLMEEGKISLDGKISTYLPEYPKAAGEKATIHQLLNHTSGIPSYTGLQNFFKDLSRDPYEPEDFLDVFANMELEFEPGSQFKYNNSGYFLLGAIIEKVNGYGWFIREVPIGKNGKKVHVIEHGGGINGFATGFRRFVDDRHLIVCMDNTSQGQNDMMQGIANILYGEPADDPKLSIAEMMLEIIDRKGIDAGIEKYKKLKENQAEAYNFRENELNRLGYHFLKKGDSETALVIFKLNIEAYPEASNPYDSYAEALMKSGDNEGAIQNYKKSLELNPGNTPVSFFPCS